VRGYAGYNRSRSNTSQEVVDRHSLRSHPRALLAVIHNPPDGHEPSGQFVFDLASLNPRSISSSSSPSSSLAGSFSHHRRRSSSSIAPQPLDLHGASRTKGTSPSRGTGEALSPIPGTPQMSLSRSPSPRPGGGWASPGLSSPYGSGSGSLTPQTSYRGNGNSNSVTWESAKAKSEGLNGYPSFSTQNSGFFNRHYRKISSNLPRFNLGSEKSYAEKEKLGRGRWSPRDGSKLARIKSLIRRVGRKMKLRVVIVLALFLMIILFYMTRKDSFYGLWALLI